MKPSIVNKQHLRRTLLTLCLILSSTALILGCSRVQLPKVHKIDIQQGNVITQEAVEKLKPGMDKNQVRQILGTPLLEDPFHRDRWDYFYTLKPGRGITERRHLTLRFEQELLAHLEGDVALRLGPPPVRDKITQTVAVPAAEPNDGLVNRMLNTIGRGDDLPTATTEQLAGLPAPTGETPESDQPAATPVEDDWGLFDGLLKD